jgi:hypothetical protein
MSTKKQCENCNKLFNAKRSNGLYCNDACRIANNRKKSEHKNELFEIQKKLDFIIDKLNGLKVEEKATKPLRQITKQVSSPEPEVKKKSVMDYAMQIDKLQFDEEYRAMAKEIRADANLNEKQKTALIASMNCPNI